MFSLVQLIFLNRLFSLKNVLLPTSIALLLGFIHEKSGGVTIAWK